MSSKTDEETSESKPRAEGTFSSSFSAFPIDLWNEWNEVCEKYYGNCRWIKMWDDHQKAKLYPLLLELIKRIETLENKANGSEGEKPVRTLTKTYGGDDADG